VVELTYASGSIVTLQHGDKVFLYLLHFVLQVCILLTPNAKLDTKLLILNQLIRMRNVGSRGGLSEEETPWQKLPIKFVIPYVRFDG